VPFRIGQTEDWKRASEKEVFSLLGLEERSASRCKFTVERRWEEELTLQLEKWNGRGEVLPLRM